jgi:predicted amidohydrolase
MNIAIIQADIKDKDIEKNLLYYNKVLDNLEKDVDLVILPEMFLTGFTADISLAKQSEEKGLIFMRNTAKDKSVAIEGSLLIGENNHYYNRHYFIHKDNTSYYDKRHLFSMSKEKEYLTCGNEKTIVTYNGFKILLMTCYDLRFPVWSMNSCNDNSFLYDIIVYVASWPKSRKSQWKKLLMARAIENQSYVIGVNRKGKDINNISYSGDSCIINPKGIVIKPYDIYNQTIFYYSVEKENIEKYRKNFQVSKDWYLDN